MLDLGSGRTTRLKELSEATTVPAVFDWEKNSVIYYSSDRVAVVVSETIQTRKVQL